MSSNLKRVISLLTILAALVVASTTRAGSLTPNPANGSPHTAASPNGFYVSLIPDPASYRSPAIGCPWLVPAAQSATQPYNTDANNAWFFNYAAAFNGTFNMTTYAATNDGTYGGADFTITYTPGAGDPTGADVRWMQVIDTNMPTTRGVTYGVPGTPAGYTSYLDNAGPDDLNNNPPVDPYYGWLTATNPNDITTSTAANSTSFTDTPALPLAVGRDWEAQVFVVSETTALDPHQPNITDHYVTIYGGVWWGFRVIPEPSTIVLNTIGAIGLLVYGLRRKRAA